MNSLEKRLLQLTVFLIPSNLAYHWYTNEAYVNGFLIDYLLPKLYLSDIPIFLLLLFWMSRSRQWFSFFSKPITLSLIAYLAITSLLSPKPIAAIWFVSKLVQLALFTYYLLRELSLKQFLSTIRLPLITGLLFQLIIGSMQYINQSSVIGYILLGESHLEGTSSIAKDSFSGALKILPYGTTPHPNVLAGYVTIGALLVIISSIQIPKKSWFFITDATTICLLFLSLFIIQSQASILAALISISLPLLYQQRNMLVKKLISPLVIVSTIFGLVIFAPFVYQYINDSDNISINRRYRLYKIHFQSLIESPLIGTGVNQSIATGIKHGLVTTPAPFLQPVHNIYILWFIEVGIFGIILTISALHLGVKRVQKRHLRFRLIPLIALLIIGLFDHYPLTLQTGQLLLTISIVLLFLREYPTPQRYNT